jgi:hypothetical protein
MRLLTSVVLLALLNGFERCEAFETSVVPYNDCIDFTVCRTQTRREFTIRASRYDGDDVGADFEEGMKAANNGGTLRLLPRKRYVIGRKINLENLTDVHLHLEGELTVFSSTFHGSSVQLTAGIVVYQQHIILATRKCQTSFSK